VAAANKLQYGPALKALKMVLQNQRAAPDLMAAAEDLQRRFDDRIGEIFTLLNELAENDLILFDYYAPRFLKQLEGHPRKKDVQALIAATQHKPAYAAALDAKKKFVAGYPYVDERSGKLDRGKIADLKFVRQAAGEKSMTGLMAADFLALE